MTIYELVTQEVDHIHYVEMLFLLADLGIEKDMKENIAKFLGQFPFLTLEDGVAEFIYFLYGLRTQRLVGLLAVPWTFFPEFIKNFYDAGKSLLFFL